MSFADVFKKIFGTKADRDMKQLRPMLNKVLEAYGNIDKLSDDQLREKCTELKKRIQDAIAADESRIAGIKEELETDIPLNRKEELATESDKLVKKVDQTIEDVLEEIVGDINDEYDEEEKTYRRLPDDTYIFEGKTLLNDFFRITGLDSADYEPVAEDCETLAGMLLAIKGDFPKEKEPLVYGRCRFLILDIEHHRITSVRVKVMPDPQT